MKKAYLLVAVALAALACAQAQTCPSAVCNSYFANAAGGPIDCCWYNYQSPGDKCSWGGTPVSFQWKGTSCVKDSKPYMVLYASNSQGPPGTPNCRCANMYSVTPPTAPGYSWSYNADIQGKDLAADGKGYYKVCAPGNPAAIAAKCNEPHKGGNCVAFTWDGNCGYLKFANGPTTFKKGWYTYKKNSATTGH